MKKQLHEASSVETQTQKVHTAKNWCNREMLKGKRLYLDAESMSF